jgi:hypothetical protein
VLTGLDCTAQHFDRSRESQGNNQGQYSDRSKQEAEDASEAKLQVTLALVDEYTCQYVDHNLPTTAEFRVPIHVNSYSFCLAHAIEMNEIEPREPKQKKAIARSQTGPR